MFNITTLKAAMRQAGFLLSEGDALTAKDMSAFYDYAHHHFGLSKEKAAYGLAYPSTVSALLPGHPDNPDTPKAEAAGIGAPEALLPPVVYPPPVPQPHPINIDDVAQIEPPVADAAEEAGAEDEVADEAADQAPEETTDEAAEEVA
jgi:hypothetical protein